MGIIFGKYTVDGGERKIGKPKSAGIAKTEKAAEAAFWMTRIKKSG